MPATHSQKLARWLPPEEIARISDSMKDWYGPPIALGNVPGKVYACAGGDFRGHIEAGSEASLLELAYDKAKRLEAHMSRNVGRWLDQQVRGNKLNSFAGIADIVAMAAQGRQDTLFFNKSNASPTAAGATSWDRGIIPVAGSAGAAAPGGTVHSYDAAGLPLQPVDTGMAEENYFCGGWLTSSAPVNVLMYDRLFSVAKDTTTTTAQVVTGTPSRYTDTSVGGVGNGDCFGNFVFTETVIAVPATGYTWVGSQYINQDGTTVKAFPSVSSFAGAAAGTLAMDSPAHWYFPLASGDYGIYAIERIKQSATTGAHAINFVLGHPIAFFPCPIANILLPIRAIQSAFQLERIRDGATLSFIEAGGLAGAKTIQGAVKVVSTD